MRGEKPKPPKSLQIKGQRRTKPRGACKCLRYPRFHQFEFRFGCPQGDFSLGIVAGF